MSFHYYTLLWLNDAKIIIIEIRPSLTMNRIKNTHLASRAVDTTAENEFMFLLNERLKSRRQNVCKNISSSPNGQRD